MNIGKGKTDKISTLFNGLLKKTTPYIPAMYTDGKDTFVSTTKQQQTEQKPTKEQLLSKLKEVDIPEESKAKIEKYAKEDYQIAQAYKLLSSPQLYQNQNVLNSLYLILYTAYSKNTELRNSLLDKYLSTPALYENEVMSSQIGNLISFATNMNKATMADIILSTPELYSSEEFTQNIDELDCISNGLEKEKILNKFLRREALYKNKEMQATIIDYLKTPTNGAQENFAYEVLDYIEQGIVSPQLAIQLVKYNEFKIEPENFKKLKNAIEPDVYSELSVDRNDIIAASRIVPLYNKSSIGEIPITQRNEVLKGLIKLNSRLFKTTDVLKKYFPLIPQSQEEYCAFLPKLATAIGVETKQLTSNQINEFNINLRELSLDVAKLSDEEIEGLEFSQKYSTDDFILDTLEIIAELSESEKSKVFDYFGFEFKENDKKPNGYSLVGYPINIESPEKKLQITDERTLQVIQALRENVIEYSEKNSITSNNEKIGALLNEMQKAFPEIHTMISKQQAEIKGNEALKYSLKVIQKIVQNPQFEGLSDSDKRVMLLTSLFHNIRKLGTTSDSAFDAYLISKKINLTDSEQIKLYTLIKNQNWLEEVDARYISNQEMIARYQNIAYDMQNGNTFELAKMFKKASLESEKTVDYVYQKSIDSLAEHSEMIEVYVEELQATKPILPITKLPKASDVNTKITTVNEDYSTNLKGVYQKDGLTIIRYNEVEDWGSLGFPKGSISSGIKKSGYEKKETGTIKFISHWVHDINSIINFQEFALPDSDVLLSASYLYSPESKALKSGLLLDVATENIHGGYNGDSYSGCEKTLTNFKKKVFEEHYSGYDREFFAKLVKETLGYSDDEYRKFLKENSNKSMSEIQPEEVRNLLIRAYSSVYTNDSLGDYNEIYVSNAKIQACYSTTGNSSKHLDTIAFVDKQKDYLKDYAKQNDLLFFVFGD